MARKPSRRDVLKRGPAWAGAALITPAILARAAGANNRVGLGVIGCGQRGQELIRLLLRRDDVAIPLLCEVDTKQAGLAAKMIESSGRPRPEIVGNLRALLDRYEIEGVVIASPDHWHCLHVMESCTAGKDLYVEAPLTHSIAEGMVMSEAVRKYARVTQVGMPWRAANWFNEVADLIQAGKLGTMIQTRSWAFTTGRPVSPTEDSEVPIHLDYDRWLGPAPIRAYNQGRSHGLWHHWWDYGGGEAARWNVHMIDLVHRAMRTNSPRSVTAVGGNQGLGDFRETPDTLEVVFDYESRILHRITTFQHVFSLRMGNGHAGWGPPMAAHNARLDGGASMHTGVQFHGREATLYAQENGVAVFPVSESQPADLNKPDLEIASTSTDPFARLHLDDFLSCMRSRHEPKAPIEAGQSAATACHLASISYRVGRRIYYDARRGGCFRDPELSVTDQDANALLMRPYREPYLPGEMR